MRKGVPILLAFFAILSLLLFILNPPFISGIFQRFFSSPKSMVYALKAGGNYTVEKEQKLLQRIVDYDIIKKDNDALRSQFENSPLSTQKLLPAKVVGFTGRANVPLILIIDKGEKENIKTNMTVIFQKNLVGRIGKVSVHFSEVILPINPNFSVVGKASETNAMGILQGEEEFVLFDNVVITDSLKKDDLVMTKGELNSDGLGIYPDIIVGKISSINKQETKPFQNAKVVPLITYSRLSEVFIIINQNN